MLCVGEFDVGLRKGVCAVCGTICVGLGSDCMLCMGQFGVGLGE